MTDCSCGAVDVVGAGHLAYCPSSADYEDLVRSVMRVLPTYGDGTREWTQAEDVIRVWPNLRAALAVIDESESALVAEREAREKAEEALRSAARFIGQRASSRTGRNPASGIELAAGAWMQEHEAVLASLSAVPAQRGEERSEIENALNLLRSINGTLTTRTGLSGRDASVRLLEYERRCQSAADQITAIADRFEALFAPQPEEEKDG